MQYIAIYYNGSIFNETVFMVNGTVLNFGKGSVVKVVFRFGCAKHLKNLERYLINIVLKVSKRKLPNSAILFLTMVFESAKRQNKI